MGQATDLELVEEVRNGKRQAFSELMRRHQERVYRLALRIVGSHDDAEDVAQETFVKAYLALGDFRGDSSFFTWVYRIAVNLSLNAIRKRQVVTYLGQSELLKRVLPSLDRPDRNMEFAQMQDQLQVAIAGLPEKQRLVFVMRFIEGMSYEEISEVLKTSVGGLKANYFHALHKVRELMKYEA